MHGDDPEQDKRRMIWASRRGLLELDLLLEPFMEHYYTTLTPELRADYAALMHEADQDILNWVMGREVVARTELRPVVDAIREATPGLRNQPSPRP